MAERIAHSALSRRDVMAGSAALVLAPALQMCPAAAVGPFIRRSVTAQEFAPATLESYKRAIRAMLALPPSDPRNWYRQAMIHLLDCPHGNWWFLPWHRGYLFQFEAICRQLSGDAEFALPFWDWTSSPAVPAAMFDDVLTPTHELYEQSFETFRAKFQSPVDEFWNAMTAAQRDQLALRKIASAADIWVKLENTFAERDEARSPTRDKPELPDWAALEVGAERINAALAPVRYEDFGSSQAPNHHVRAIVDTLEGGPHNNVHNALGGGPGFMSELLAPVDPIFWLHHANVDRLWSIWTAREQRAGRTGLPEDAQSWASEPFLFFGDQGTPAAEATSAQFLPTRDLGYRYSEGFGDDLLKGNPAPDDETGTMNAQTFHGDVVRSVLRTDAEASAAVRVPNALLVAARAPASRPSPGLDASVSRGPLHEPRPLVALVSLIPPTNPRALRVLFFMNCPDLSPATPLTDPHYVGSVSFFCAHAGAHGGNEPIHTTTLPLNDTLKRLAAAGQPVRNQVRLQAIAADDSGEKRILNGALTQVSVKTV